MNDMAPETVIEFAGVSKAFGENQIYVDMDLKVYAGETLTIIGGSGLGKAGLAGKHFIDLSRHQPANTGAGIGTVQLDRHVHRSFQTGYSADHPICPECPICSVRSRGLHIGRNSIG